MNIPLLLPLDPATQARIDSIRFPEPHERENRRYSLCRDPYRPTVTPIDALLVECPVGRTPEGDEHGFHVSEMPYLVSLAQRIADGADLSALLDDLKACLKRARL